MSSRLTYLRLAPFFVGLIVFIADRLSKFLTDLYLPLMREASHWYPYGGVGIFKNFLGIEFSITHQINFGAAWGAFADYQLPLLLLRIFLIFCMLAYLFFFSHPKSWIIPLTLILTGATGNVLDFFTYGHVVDMLHFVLWGYDFPVFNLADSSIFIGIMWLFCLSGKEKKGIKDDRTISITDSKR